MRRLAAALLVAATAVTVPAVAAARSCDPEVQNCTLDCLRHAYLEVDPEDPYATVRGLSPACPH